MSILDLQANFSGTTATSYIGSAGTYLCPNTYDTGPLAAYFTAQTASDTTLSANVNTGRDLGGGERIWLVIQQVQAAAGGTSANFQFVTQSASTLASPTVLAQTGVILTAALTANSRSIIALPRSAAYAQYIGVQAVTAGTMSAGTFLAWLSKDIDAVVLGYASGFGLK